jgi:hypothetical protein
MELMEMEIFPFSGGVHLDRNVDQPKTDGSFPKRTHDQPPVWAFALFFDLTIPIQYIDGLILIEHCTEILSLVTTQ